MAQRHVIPFDVLNLHGRFSHERPPILTVDDGDQIELSTPQAGWRLAPDDRIDPPDSADSEGHCLVGPIAVRGAKPGMTLEIRFHEVVPSWWGGTITGFPHEVFDRLDLKTENLIKWSLDAGRGVGTTDFGVEVSLRPFLGVVGLAPQEAGWHSTVPPRRTGGNIDCRELIAETSLFLPVEVEGALLSMGDGHAAQGDGEVGVTAIECPMDRVVVSVHLHSELELKLPRIRTADSWVCLGFSEDLDEAAYLALEGILDVIQDQAEVDRQTALGLASVVASLRVTQIVNGVKGVHAVLEDGALRRSE